MLLKNGDSFEPEPEDIEKWKLAYPNVNVEVELRAMSVWCDANPGKRKTSRGIKRFITSWLSRAQDQGGSPMAKQGVVSTRSMSLEDDLTHVFIETPGIKQRFLDTHGQYFINGQRVTT